MNRMIAKFREQNVAHHYRFFARSGPARQSEQRAPVALVRNSVTDQIVVLTMIEHRHANHARVFDRAAHHLVILNAMTVICYRHNARLREGPDRCEFFASEIFEIEAAKTLTHAELRPDL
jgi:hypothetical protein